MRLLQRYILFELLRVFALLLTVLTVLLVFVGVFREVSESGLGPFQVLQILPYIVPSLLPFTIPATFLLTVCVVYGRLAGDHEATAAKAAGINLLSLLWPAFSCGAVLSVCSLLLADQLIPWSVGNIQRIVTSAMEDIFLDVLKSQNHIIDWYPGTTITVTRVEDKKLIQPNFRFTLPGGDAVVLQAQEATFDFDLDHQQVMLHMVQVDVDVPGQGTGRFAQKDYAFPLPSTRNNLNPRHLSIREIRHNVEAASGSRFEAHERRDVEASFALALGEFDRFLHPEFTSYEDQLARLKSEHNRLQAELHSRFALSCSCFFFTLMGCPFSILQARRHFVTSFFLCFLPVLLVYYPVVLLMMNLSKMGNVNPAWAMWVGNLLLLAVGWFVLRKAMRH